MTYQLHHGDCLNIMPLIERESVDAVICDPPYGLGFMGKDWDHGVPGMHFWLEALRCAKPGAYLLAFGGTRTFHRLAVAIEDAGWEIRDTVMWVYGQGFPKSHDVSKAIDREAGAEREIVGHKGGRYDYGFTPTTGAPMGNISPRENSPTNKAASGNITAPSTEAAAEWDGWGTALKPAWEPIIVARKPLQGTVAENVQRYGTGALNIDACRIGVDDSDPNHRPNPSLSNRGANSMFGSGGHESDTLSSQGRWPANLIHDGSAEVLAGFPNVHGAGSAKQAGGHNRIANRSIFDNSKGGIGQDDYGGARHGDTGSAARFFYCAKASKQDRDEGLEELEPYDRENASGNNRTRVCALCGLTDNGSNDHSQCGDAIENRTANPARNHHPTVKPTALMRYLCRLVTPPNGVILDPFMGSGSTGKAAMLEGFNFIGIDTEIEYVEIAARRIEHACEKVGIVVDQPMMFETKRETVDRPKQLILL